MDPLAQQLPTSLKSVGHWQGKLQLGLNVRQGKTMLASKHHSGPYTVQRPFYPEPARPDICHLYLLHPPGGLVEGDTLELAVECHPHSHTLITTPSAGKVYECSTAAAGQHQHFSIKSDATLEWFPQEMILYNKSISDLQTRIDLHGNAKFAGWEMMCLGRPIADDLFSEGSVLQNIKLYRDDQPLLLERTYFNAQDAIRKQNWGLVNYESLATFVMTSVTKQQLEIAQTLVNNVTASTVDIQAGVTLLDDILVCRALAHQSRFIKTLFISLWSTLRSPVLNAPAVNPRIWNT